MKEALGQDIKIGDCITHGVREGNSGAHRLGIVQDITPENKLKVLYVPTDYRGTVIQDARPTRATIHYHNGVVLNIDEIKGNELLRELQEIRKYVLNDV